MQNNVYMYDKTKLIPIFVILLYFYLLAVV